MTCRVFSLRNRKHKLWNKYIRSKSDTDFQHYCKVRNELRNLTRTLRINYENKLVSNVKINPRQFWKYVNSQLKVHPKIDSLQCLDNTVSHLDSEKSEQLNKYFSSVFTREDSSDIPPFSLDADIDPLTDVEFTPCAVHTKLINLDPSKASGPEGWPILSLKECAQQLSIPLSILFSKSFNSSSLPTTWKEAFVTPIYKKGDRTLVSNYRPISLTSPIVKIMESIIRDRIQEHMITNDLFTPYQHGFTVGKSCVTQLLTAVDFWTKSLEDSYAVDVIYFDLAKAFDSVPHTRLLTKLEAYGLTEKLLGWLRSYLVGRRQKVVINGYSSTWCEVSSGVPQGSVLGPLLFNIYVNDIASQVNSTILQFADDLKMFRVIHDVTDFNQLQEDIDSLVTWANKWQLRFNVSKCHLLHLGKLHYYGTYNIQGNLIPPSESVKDLGVIIDDKLKFHDHVASVTAKANRTLAVIHKSFHFTSGNMYINLYKSLVRPIIEYGNTIWGPHYILDQHSIEQIQRRATRILTGLYDTPYSDRLNILKLPTLQYRRLRGDMILLHRLLHNNIGIHFSDYFTRSFTSTRGHSYKIFKPHATTRIRSNFFATRSIDAWNRLPEYIIEAHVQSTNSFKNLFDTYYSNQMFVLDS